MVLEKPTLQRDKIATEFIKGQRAAKRGGKYFNPYSKVTQSKSYKQFEYGWNDQLKKMHVKEMMQENPGDGRGYKIAILAFGILLIVIVWYMNN